MVRPSGLVTTQGSVAMSEVTAALGCVTATLYPLDFPRELKEKTLRETGRKLGVLIIPVWGERLGGVR